MEERSFKIRAKAGPTSCPYCRDVVETDSAQKTCPRCQAVMHSSCAQTSCPIFGCGEPLTAGTKTGLEYRPMRGRRRSPRFERPGLGVIEFVARCALIGGLLLIPMGVFLNLDGRETNNLIPIRIGLGAAALGLLLYASLNGIQALVLSRARRASRNQDYEGLVAIYGKAEVDGAPLETSFGEPCLYFYEAEEHFVRDHRQRASWKIESERELCRPLKINGVRVENRPSEIYGMKTHQESLDRITRRRTSYLPVGRPMTVMGWVRMRDGEPYLSNHGEAGMIFSTFSPSRTMLQELSKALLFLALGLVSTLLALLL